MIYDATEFPDASDMRAQFCIVGAGPAGIALALKLAELRCDVILLESGGLLPEPRTQALYEGSVADEHLHSPTDRYRVRQLGGSSTVWGGRCMPFDPIDFEARDYVPHSGWPFGLEELAPYYPAATELCEAGPYEFDANTAFPHDARPMIAGFSGNAYTTSSLERFSCPTDFGRRYRARLQAESRIRVVLHANATSLDLAEDGRSVRTVTARTLGGKTLRVHAAHCVLATGGLEVARILLANRSVQPAGIGNDHDLVGRYYMCHLAGTIGSLALSGGVGAVWHGYDRAANGVYCRRRLALTPRAQRRERVGNFIARLHHPRITNPEHHNAVLSLLYLAKPLIPYEYRKRLHGDDAEGLSLWLRHCANVARGPFDAVGFAWHMLRDRRLAKRKFPSIIIKPKASLFSIDFHAEQFPNPQSRVMLGAGQDALGMPRIHVDWRYLPQDVATVVRALELLRDDVRASGVGELTFDREAVEAEMTRYGAYGGHHIGTARLGADPRQSVVDPNCRVHSVDNLHVASAATFPTSSQANPTLTVVAMALRLAHHLAGQRPVNPQPAAAATPPTSHRGAVAVKKRVLVLGASGLVGRVLIEQLSRTGWATPIAASRRAVTAGLGTDVETLALDATDAAAMRAVLARVDAVVNCIAGSPDSIIAGAQNIVDACRGLSEPPHLVQLSSLAVYGSTVGEVDETAPVRDDHGPYGHAKILAEMTLTGYTRATIFRPGIIYGPGSARWSGEIASLLLSGRLGDIGVAGDGICNLVHVADVAGAVVLALSDDSRARGIYNLSTPAPMSWNEYFRLFAAALGVEQVARISKARLGTEVLLFGPVLRAAEIAHTRLPKLTAAPPTAIRPWLLKICRQKIHMRVARAEQDLGLRFQAVGDGLRDTARWVHASRGRESMP